MAKTVEKRLATLEKQVEAFIDCKLCYSKRFHRLDEGTKAKLKTIEITNQTVIDIVGRYQKELSHLRGRLALLTTLHRNELGLLGVDVEKWLNEE